MTTGGARAIKLIAIVLGIYVAIVVIFESLLGYFQPEDANTVVITTTADGRSHDRVLTLLERDDVLYVAANHWPRAWYKRALDNPEVQLTLNGEQAEYLAVRVTGSEHDRLSEAFAVGLFFRFLTGFPPRYFVRLDPVAPPAAAVTGAVAGDARQADDDAMTPLMDSEAQEQAEGDEQDPVDSEGREPDADGD